MDFKDLEKLLKLARKYGLATVKTQDIEFTVDLSHANKPKAKRTQPLEPFGVSEDDRIEMPDALTQEELLFYSATGQPVPDQQ